MTVIPQNNIKDFFKSDRAILMICMGIALVFWLITNLSQNYDTEIKVRVAFNVPSNKILREPPPTLLNVSLNGSGWDLMFRYLSGRPRLLTFDLTPAEQKTITKIDLKKKVKDNISANITVTEISPENIVLRLDKPIEKQVPITVKTDIKTIPQYQLAGDVQLLPNEIILSGPQSVLADISMATTNKIKIKNVNKNNFGTIQVKPFENSQVSFKPQAVNYIANVEQVTEKILEVPVEFNPQKDTLSIQPQSIKVICTIGLSKYETLNDRDFKAVLDTTNIKSKKYAGVHLVQTPDFLKPEQIRFYPAKVQLFWIEEKERK